MSLDTTEDAYRGLAPELVTRMVARIRVHAKECGCQQDERRGAEPHGCSLCAEDRAIVAAIDGPKMTCPHCGRTSYNLNDVRERSCGACHLFFRWSER